MRPRNAHLSGERAELVARLLRDAGPSAPPRLRTWIETESARAHTRRHSWHARLPARPPLAAAALAAAVVALSLALPVIIDGGPSVVDAHALAGRSVVSDAPPPQPGRPTLLARRVGRVTFPNWSSEDWVPSGQRSDVLGGRRTATVFYRHGKHRIAYTIVSGEPLDAPADARLLRVNGVDLRLFNHGGHEVAVFERSNQTCVLTAHVRHTSTLLRLATWRADGQIGFSARVIGARDS